MVKKWVVGACLGALLGFVGCTGEGVPQSDYDAVLDSARKQKMEIDELQSNLEKSEAALDEANRNTALKKANEDLDKLLEEAEARQDELDALQKEFQDYKKEYQVSVRQKIIGKKIARLETTKRVYEEVTVKDVTPIGLRVTYSEGGGRIRFEDLDEQLQNQLGYDENEAAEYLADEAERRAEAASKVADVRTKQREQHLEATESMAKSDIQGAKVEIGKLELFIRAANGTIAQLESEARNYDYKHRIARLRGKSSSWTVRATTKRRSAATMRNKIHGAERRIIELQAKVDSAGS